MNNPERPAVRGGDPVALPGEYTAALALYSSLNTGFALLCHGGAAPTLEALRPLCPGLQLTTLAQLVALCPEELEVKEVSRVDDDGIIVHRVGVNVLVKGRHIGGAQRKKYFGPDAIAARVAALRDVLEARAREAGPQRPPAPLEAAPLALNLLRGDDAAAAAGEAEGLGLGQFWRDPEAGPPRGMDIDGFLRFMGAHPFYKGQIECRHDLPARAAVFADHAALGLRPEVLTALSRIGITRLYAHQVQAIGAVFAGRDVVVCTSTSSGKSLCYQVPMMQRMLEEDCCSFYIAPTKALAQDQLRSLSNLLPSTTMVNELYATYDGDTSEESRPAIRERARIILTNPDMLHVGILPNHDKWRKVFSSLRHIVIDEAHSYRGVFGSHVALVLRRLLRIARGYGSNPVFILCSATIANPAEHCRRLTTRDPVVVDQDGSPCGERTFLLWNPPLIATNPKKAEGEGEKGDAPPTTTTTTTTTPAPVAERALSGARRTSSYMEVANLFVELVKHGLKTLAFGKVRNVAELILRYAKERLKGEVPELLGALKCYRGGYRPEERRAIEQELFRGELAGVTSTNALELGVDIGTLDAVLLTGFPGCIASLWQQSGRAGRGTKNALAILVALQGPLDQHIVLSGAALFTREPEAAVVDPANPLLLSRHLACAVREIPVDLRTEAEAWGGEAVALPVLNNLLVDEGTVAEREDGTWWYHQRGPKPPAMTFGLRSACAKRFRVLRDGGGAECVEEVEETTAYYRLYVGAVYLYQGDTYMVTRLAIDSLTAFIRPARVRYYTVPVDERAARFVAASMQKPIGAASRARYGSVNVVEKVTAFRKVWQVSETSFETVPLDLPAVDFATKGTWVDVPPGLRAVAEITLRGSFEGGLEAIAHLMVALLPLFVITEPWDVASLSNPCHPDSSKAQLVLYDAIPGGIGISERAYDRMPELLTECARCLERCSCAEGCPACIQSPSCSCYNKVLDKRIALFLLKEILSTPK